MVRSVVRLKRSSFSERAICVMCDGIFDFARELMLLHVNTSPAFSDLPWKPPNWALRSVDALPRTWLTSIPPAMQR